MGQIVQQAHYPDLNRVRSGLIFYIDLKKKLKSKSKDHLSQTIKAKNWGKLIFSSMLLGQNLRQSWFPQSFHQEVQEPGVDFNFPWFLRQKLGKMEIVLDSPRFHSKNCQLEMNHLNCFTQFGFSQKSMNLTTYLELIWIRVRINLNLTILT